MSIFTSWFSSSEESNNQSNNEVTLTKNNFSEYKGTVTGNIIDIDVNADNKIENVCVSLNGTTKCFPPELVTVTKKQEPQNIGGKSKRNRTTHLSKKSKRKTSNKTSRTYKKK
jgi:hypothetical protein